MKIIRRALSSNYLMIDKLTMIIRSAYQKDMNNVNIFNKMNTVLNFAQLLNHKI